MRRNNFLFGIFIFLSPFSCYHCLTLLRIQKDPYVYIIRTLKNRKLEQRLCKNGDRSHYFIIAIKKKILKVRLYKNSQAWAEDFRNNVIC